MKVEIVLPISMRDLRLATLLFITCRKCGWPNLRHLPVRGYKSSSSVL